MQNFTVDRTKLILRRLPRATLLSVSCAIILSACETLTPTPAPDAPAAACSTFRRISFDRFKDTEETIIQIKAHNVAWRCLCKNECKVSARVDGN